MHVKIFSALLSSVFLFSCSPDFSSQAGGRQITELVQRPSKEVPSIIARELNFQNDERISYCEILSSDKKSYSGYRDQKLYPLASLSKVITTAWALKKLGPDYSIESTWYFKPVNEQAGIYDAYLKTNYDPVFNIEKILYSLSLMKSAGIYQIRDLVIDETSRIYLSALSQPHIELDQIPISSAESAQNLQLLLNSENWSSQTQTAKQSLLGWAARNKKNVDIPAKFSVKSVQVKSSSSITLDEYTKQITLKSSPLLKYLKNLNVFSNNYISDSLFWYLGGVNEFRKFQSTELQLSNNELQLFTGSGLADFQSGVRKDNLGTCVAMLKILNYIDVLAQKNGLNLGHFLYNPSQDSDGTFESNLNFTNQVVIKTGRLFENPALNVAGIASTVKGSLYFSFMGHGFSPEAALEIQKARDQMLKSALRFYPTKSSFMTLEDFEVFLK